MLILALIDFTNSKDLVYNLIGDLIVFTTIVIPFIQFETSFL